MDKVQFEAHARTFVKMLHCCDVDDFSAVLALQDVFYDTFYKPEFKIPGEVGNENGEAA